MKDYKNLDLKKPWLDLTLWLKQSFNLETASLTEILFLIGIQELGQGKRIFSKEEKQDLIHIAICQILSLSNYYKFEKKDQDGWPIWTISKPIPYLNVKEQETFIKFHVLKYFKKISDDNSKL